MPFGIARVRDDAVLVDESPTTWSSREERDFEVAILERSKKFKDMVDSVNHPC